MSKLSTVSCLAMALAMVGAASQTFTTNGGTINTVPVVMGSTTVGTSVITQSSNSTTAPGSLTTGTVAAEVTVPPIGYVDVRATIGGHAGALCNGSADDTAAIQRAINYAAAHDLAIHIPGTGSACVVSQLNVTNLNNKIRIVGDAGPISFQSVISCNETASNTGICIDLTGSQYIDIENLRIQYGTPPLAVIRMGKSSGGNGNNGNSQIIVTRLLDVEAGGSYAVYNNGGEVWSSYNDTFAGATIAQVVLSSGNTAAVSSPFTTLPSMPVSMSDVSFYGDNFVGGNQTILFDYGSGGTVEDVQILGGYGQTTSGHPFIADSGTGALRGLNIAGFRLEPQGGNPYPFMSMTQPTLRATVNAMYAAGVAPSTPGLVFGLIAQSSINLQPGDNPAFYPSTLVSCTFAEATLITDYANSSGQNTVNNCPGSNELTLQGTKGPIQSYPLSNSAQAGWYKLGTFVASSSNPGGFMITILTGQGFNSNAGQESVVHLLTRLGNGTAAPNVSGAYLYAIGNGPISHAALVATGGSTSSSNLSWDVYLQESDYAAGSYTIELPYNGSWTHSDSPASSPGGASNTVVPATVAGWMTSDGSLYSPTAPPGTSSTQVANTAFVTAALSAQAAKTGSLTAIIPLKAVTASLGGSPLPAGCTNQPTTKVDGATTSMVCEMSGAGGTQPANIVPRCFVSAANTVTPQLCTSVAITPPAQAYNVRVIP